MTCTITSNPCKLKGEATGNSFSPILCHVQIPKPPCSAWWHYGIECTLDGIMGLSALCKLLVYDKVPQCSLMYPVLTKPFGDYLLQVAMSILLRIYLSLTGTSFVSEHGLVGFLCHETPRHFNFSRSNLIHLSLSLSLSLSSTLIHCLCMQGYLC